LLTHTDRQTNSGKNITSLAEVNIILLFSEVINCSISITKYFR